MKKNKLIKSIFCWFLLLPIISIIIFPFAFTLLTAIKPRNELTLIPPQFIPSKFFWVNFVEVWEGTNILRTLVNSFFVSFTATLITIIIGSPCAYALVRFDFKGKNFLRFFLLVTQMISPIVLVLGLFRVMVGLGLVDSIGFLSVIYAAFNVAFCVWMLQSYFQTIPRDIEESAWLEGAGRMKTLLSLFMPLAIPAVTVVAMFVFVNSWNEFIIAFSMLRDSSSFTVQLGIVEMIGYYSVRWDYVMVTIIVATLPVALVFLWLQKHLIKGLTSGSVK